MSNEYSDDYLRAGQLRWADLDNQETQERSNLQNYAAQHQASGRTDMEAFRSMGVCESNLGLIRHVARRSRPSAHLKQLISLRESKKFHTHRGACVDSECEPIASPRRDPLPYLLESL